MIKSQLVVGEPVGYFTKVVEDLNSGLMRTNPARGQGRTRSSASTAWPRCLLSCRKERMTLNIRKKIARCYYRCFPKSELSRQTGHFENELLRFS